MTILTRGVIGAALLAIVALGSGCGERSAQQSHGGQALGLLWREPPPPPGIRTQAGPAAAAPDAADHIIWTVHLQEIVSLAALASSCPQVLSQPGGAVVPMQSIAPLLVPRQTPELGTGMDVLQQGPQPVMWSFLSAYAYIADYIPASDGLTPMIGTLHFGNAVALTGHVHGTDVVCDAVCARRLELGRVATYQASYPLHGLLTTFPWEEPECLASAAERRTDPVTLTSGQVLVIPFRCWMDRPTPQVRSFAVRIDAASSTSFGPESWNDPRPAVLIVSAIRRSAAGNPASMTGMAVNRSSGVERIRTVLAVDEPSRLLSPPWHGDASAFNTPDHIPASDPQMQPAGESPVIRPSAAQPGF